VDTWSELLDRVVKSKVKLLVCQESEKGRSECWAPNAFEKEKVHASRMTTAKRAVAEDCRWIPIIAIEIPQVSRLVVVITDSMNGLNVRFCDLGL
jgi:hypothetical protein